ncbi:site-2 protease family protein [Paenibacillus sp. P96]|uniref:Site-2 protease family protein n=1 Tax=Paenibacillus zeirhizosphaerae TaxID=2987519 RepID=A0ABT9FR95_9BACL|nr:site-2 protease family protein [Paenibacillus sp. P96]MDP4097252.1 site-2 protease family protein [Paenibacillus sp. P96]
MVLKQEESKKSSSIWSWGAVIVLLLAKGKSLLALLKLGKFGGALLSMAASIGAYALIYPWSFAIGFVLLLFVHELGHVIAAKRKGLPVSAPVFIPFLGALIALKKHPQDAVTEAYMAFGGPLLGTVGSTAVFVAAYITDSPLLYALSYVGFFLNLINLLPIHPLDGGRIATAVTRWLWVVGLVGGLVVIIYLKSFVFFIIWGMFAFDLYKKYIRRRPNEQSEIETDSFLLPVEHLKEQGMLIPGPEHRRELPYMTYSDREGRQYVKVLWESMDFEGTLALPRQGIIERVHVYKIEPLEAESGLHLRIHVAVDYAVFENDSYYEVPLASRLKFGLGYVGLALFLGGMMYLVHKVGNVAI